MDKQWLPIKAKYDLLNDYYPAQLFYINNEKFNLSNKTSTYYGFCIDRHLDIKSQKLSITLQQQMFFAATGIAEINSHGRCIIIERLGFRGLQTFGGPVENTGRLDYIDGCRSSLLVYPPRLGDGCLNLLTFPANVTQSEHTHPTYRVGVINDGDGWCISGKIKTRLKIGTSFYLKPGQKHYFMSGKNGLSAIAYHPESDWGPTDQDHPMINRTYKTKK